MAEAEIIPPSGPKRIKLILSEEEADVLTAILCRIGGDMLNSPRKHQEAIERALIEATGVGFGQTKAYHLMEGGTIRFRDYGHQTERGDC